MTHITRRTAILAALALPIPGIARVISSPDLVVSGGCGIKMSFRITADATELNRALENAKHNLDAVVPFALRSDGIRHPYKRRVGLS